MEVCLLSLTKVYQLGLSMVVLTVVAFIGERHRGLAGLLAAMPLQIPLAIWIVYSSTNGNPGQTTEFARAAFFGIIPTAIFCLVCWLALSHKLALPWVYVVAYGVWLVAVLISFRLLPK